MGKQRSHKNGDGNSKRLADDLLFGSRAIGEEMGVDERAAQHMLVTGQLDAANPKKIGRVWTVTRSGLRRLFRSEV